MNEQFGPVGFSYAQFILAKWEEITLVREQFLQNYMNDKEDSLTVNNYICLMVSMWEELYPKLKGRSELKDLVTKFEDFKAYRFDPKEIYKNNDPTVIIELDQTLREAVEVLKITHFEGMI